MTDFPTTKLRRALVAAIAATLTFTLPGISSNSQAASAHTLGPGTVSRLASAAAAERVVPFEVEAGDGTVLRGDVHLPGGDAPVGTVLIHSPYWNTVARGPGELYADAMTDALVDAGFGVALVNLRGTGKSDGCFQFGGRADWADARTVIEGLADQPWSNGKVGMYGISYEGWAQYMAMAAAPPSLKAIVPESGVIDLWSLLTRRGAPIDIGPAVSGVYGGATSLASLAPEVVHHHRCPELWAEHLAEAAELVSTGDRTAYYRLRDLRQEIRDSSIPALVTNGLVFYDEGHTLQFKRLWRLLRSERTRFLLGQWGHNSPRDYRSDYPTMVINWFDHYLRSGPKRVATGVVEYQDDTGVWHIAKSWPPAAERTTLHLSGQRLTTTASAVATSQTFQSADVDTRAGCGPHQAVYVSRPLAEDVLIAGYFHVTTTLSSSQPGGNLVATLMHTPGDGSCLDLALQAKESMRMELDLRHWKTPGQSQAFPVNTPTHVSAGSLPLVSRVAAGERLVLAIGAGSRELLPDPLKPAITILTGDGTTNTLTVPVVSGDLRFESVSP